MLRKEYFASSYHGGLNGNEGVIECLPLQILAPMKGTHLLPVEYDRVGNGYRQLEVEYGCEKKVKVE